MQKNLQPILIASVERGKEIENIHYGWIISLDKEKNITTKIGNIKDDIFLRSTAKLIQAIPSIETNAKFSEKEIAVICSSHIGSNKHISVLKNLLKKYKISECSLQCGIQHPSDEREKNRLIKNNFSPLVLHNNCSGKHIGMLIACKYNNWNNLNYLSNEHELQQIILKKITEYSKYNNIKIGIDGCSAPTYALPLEHIALMFHSFSIDKNNFKIISSIKNNPTLIGGEKRIDTEIIRASKGNLIAKVGAGGLIYIGGNKGTAIIKIADGNNDIRSFITVNYLLKMNWLHKKDIKDSILEEIYYGRIKNLSGRIVGKINLEI